MAKKIIMYTAVLSFLFTACSVNPEKEIKKLKLERAQIDKKITELEKSVSTGKNSKKSVLVDIETAALVPFSHYVDIQGVVESDNNILIPARRGGTVTRVFVKEGDTVKKGALLAKTDSSILQRSADEVKTALTLAETVYKRRSNLWAKKIGSEIEYLQAKNNRDSLVKSLKTLKQQIEETKIIAPISGQIDEVFIKEGEFAKKESGAIRIVQLSKLKIAADVSESYYAFVKKGDTVEVKVSATGRVFKSTIRSAGRVINPENRTFRIEIDVNENSEGLAPNMLAVLKINDYRSKSIVVPVKVVQKTGAEPFLFVVKPADGLYKSKKVVVKAGRYYDNKVEILKGLEPGDKVVVSGFQELADRQVVQIRK